MANSSPAPTRTSMQLRGDGLITSPAWLAWFNQVASPAIQGGGVAGEDTAVLTGMITRQPAEGVDAVTLPMPMPVPSQLPKAEFPPLAPHQQEQTNLALLAASRLPAQQFPFTLSGTHANLAKYPASTFSGWFYRESDSGLLLYSDGASWLAVGGQLVDTYANWTTGNYNPANYAINTTFLISDWKVWYWVQDNGLGTHVWKYLSGTYAVVQASIAGLTGFNGGALGTNDTGLRLDVTDYAHIRQWTGSAWKAADDDFPSDTFHFFGAAPTGTGWHVCDGSSVNYLKADGTLGSRTLPPWTTPVAAYIKATDATYNPSPTAAANPTFSGTNATLANNNVAAGGINVLTTINGSNSSYAPAGSVSLPGDPITNVSMIQYYRQ